MYTLTIECDEVMKIQSQGSSVIIELLNPHNERSILSQLGDVLDECEFDEFCSHRCDECERFDND
jgi:hypothetical protein